MSSKLFYLETISDYGMKFIQLIIALRLQVEKSNAADKLIREQASGLLLKLANCLGQIETEVRSESPNLDKRIGYVKECLEAFPVIFSPLIGERKAKAIQSDILGLFVFNDHEQKLFETPSELGPMIEGLLELKEYKEEGLVDEAHTNASIATLTLVQGQLEAIADLIIFPTAFAEDNKTRIGEDADV